jgi:HSP20 family molecular chaperone IbpA
MDQARTDYMDYAMIGDATATLENGILTLRVDLRPESARG